MFDSIDHVGVAVDDLEAAVALYSEKLGMPIQHRETVEEQGVEAVLLGVGESHVELLSPLGDETPVGRFLAKKGPGMHHTAYRCADVAGAIEQCRSRGLRMIDEEPRRGIRDSLVAFVHPVSTGGVLTELVQPAAGAH
jgi:methylmalonyl-CoA/ethylmalonyl-CoA epimerase